MDNAYNIAIPPPQPPCMTATTFLDHDAANAALGFRFVRALAVEKAALDRGLSKSCTFILAAISSHMNAQCRRAWPGYQTIAQMTGYSEDVIDKSIRELERAGYIFRERKAPITGGRALVHYGLQEIRLDNYQRVITDVVLEMRRSSDPATESGVRQLHPGTDSGVRNTLTPPPTAESEADPAKFSASHPAKFHRQKPYIEEPMPAGPCARAREVFSPAQIERWKALGGRDVETLLDDELEAVWPLCRGDPGVLRSAALATLAEAKRTGIKNLRGFVRSVLRSRSKS